MVYCQRLFTVLSKMEKKTPHTKVIIKQSNPYNVKWPALSTEDEEAITGALRRLFAKHKQCMRRVKTKPKWSKKKKADTISTTSAVEEEDKLTDAELAQKKQFRSCFVVGINEVMKGLEAGTLRCVLIGKDTRPAVLKMAVLELVKRRGCAAACVSGLLAAVREGWTSMSSLTAIGVLKSEDANDFDELLRCVEANAPSIASLDLPCTSLDVTLDNKELTANKTNNKNESEKSEQNSAAAVNEAREETSAAKSQGTQDSGQAIPKTEQRKLASETGAKCVVDTSQERTLKETKSVADSNKIRFVPSKVSRTKYYKARDERVLQKSLGVQGQNYIGFGEGVGSSSHIVDEFVEIVNGVRKEDTDISVDDSLVSHNLGIAGCVKSSGLPRDSPVASDYENMLTGIYGDSGVKIGQKRKFKEGSDSSVASKTCYVDVTVKQMNRVIVAESKKHKQLKKELRKNKKLNKIKNKKVRK